MIDNFIQITEGLLSLGIAILYLVLSKYRMKKNEEYVTECDSLSYVICRLLITLMLKYSSVMVIICFFFDGLGTFVAFYILTPIILALNFVFFDTEWIRGLLAFIKGLYYAGLSIISIIQCLLGHQAIDELAFGFTLSLAIFESVTAISEGYSKMYGTKGIPQRNVKN